MKTRSIKQSEIVNNWILIDATDIRLGRLATTIAELLMGKNKVNNADYVFAGDNVVVINAAKLSVSDKHLVKNKYYTHSNYPGGLRVRKLKDLMVSNPQYVVREAVWGMIPKNRLGRELITKLHVYPGSEHKHAAQKLVKMEIN